MIQRNQWFKKKVCFTSFKSIEIGSNPTAEVLCWRIDGRSIEFATWNAPRYNSNLVEWELSIFMNWQLQWTAWISLATCLAWLGSSTNDLFIDLRFRPEHTGSAEECFTSWCTNDWHLNLFQVWWLWTSLTCNTPSGWKWVLASPRLTFHWFIDWQANWSDAV